MTTIRRSAPFIALLLILGLLITFLQLESQSSSIPILPTGNAQQGVEVFFTSPNQSSSLRGGPDAALAQAIESARYSVDMAIYKLDLWSIRDALIAAHRQGVDVRLVVESDYFDEPEVQALVAAGIEVQEDQREALMHHKFTVIDRYEVWTGSMNYSVNGAYRHDNNLLRVRSAEVAANYTREFEEMFQEGRFGAISRSDTPYPISEVEQQRVGVYFSPDDDVIMQLLHLIQNATTSIDMLAFSLTSDPLGAELLQAHASGVKVRLVVEKDQAGNSGSEVAQLQDAGVALRMDGNPNSMHHKVILIDGDTVVTGSYNFSRSAEDFNDENVIILHNPELAADYLVEFNRIYDQAR